MSHPCLFSIVPSSLVSTGYSTEKLQFHTNLKWITEDKYIMFNIHFHGYLFKGNKAIFSILTGYLYGPYGLYQSNCQNITDAINISVYKSQSQYMCFEIDNKGIDWHASDLRLDLIMGNSGYTQASKEMKIETVRLGTRY